MSCHQFDEAIVEASRGGPLPPFIREHIEACARCRAALRHQERLTRGLHDLAASAPDGVSDAAEAALMAAFDAHAANRRTPWRTIAGTAAAAVLLAATIIFALRDFERVQQRIEPPAAPSAFVPWPGADTLPAFESGEIVRTELPVSVLPLLGIQPATAVRSETVPADVLIGQDGLARAVRLAN